MSDRYIKLNGDAIHERLRNSFWRSSGILATGMIFGTHAIIMASRNHFTPAQAAISLTALFGCYAAGEMAVRMIDRSILTMYFGDLEAKCLDTRPDNKTPPTGNKDYSASRNHGLISTFGVVGYCTTLAINCLFNGPSAFFKKEYLEPLSKMPDSEILIQAFGFIAMSRVFMHCYRQNKVQRRQYVITDTPPPELKRETVANLAFNPA